MKRAQTGLAAQALHQPLAATCLPANSGHGPHSAVAIGYLCEVIGGTLRTSHEAQDVRYGPIEAVTDWHEKHLEYALAARTHWQDNPGPGAGVEGGR